MSQPADASGRPIYEGQTVTRTAQKAPYGIERGVVLKIGYATGTIRVRFEGYSEDDVLDPETVLVRK